MSLSAAFDYIEKNEKRFVDELLAFLRIPSISAHKERDADVLAALDFDRKKLESLGFRTEVWPTRSHPGLFAEKIVDPDAPTVLIYGHVDVQPVDPLDQWKIPPFEPEIRDGKIWARGADDNKGQHYSQIAGVEAVARTGTLPVNVKFIIESDEEYDGEAMAEVFPQHREALRCDAAMIADSQIPDLEHPALTTSLRGIQAVEIEIRGPAGDLHSGEWGGMTFEPLDLVRWVIQNLRDFETGKVLLPGFYDDVIEPTAEERRAIAAGPWDDTRAAKSIGVKRLSHEKGYTVRESGTVRPTLQVNGIQGGYTGEGFKTVIGARARAKISMRLVPNQDPERIYQLFERRVRDLVGDMASIEFRRFGAGRPFRTELSNPYVQAGVKALAEAFGKPAVVMGMGGSIPIVAPLADLTGAPCVLAGFGLPGDNLHAPNEHFPLACFRGGARYAAAYLHEVASRARARVAR